MVQKRVRYMGDARSMANAGWFLLAGEGVEKNDAQGMELVKSSAELGSDYAAIILGNALFHGFYRVEKDWHQAKHWLTRAVDGSCTCKHLRSYRLIELARTRLSDIEDAESESEAPQ